MNARDKDRLLAVYLGISISDANTLRRAALTLHAWDEGCCGDGNDWASWCITRDEETGIPYREVYPHTSGKMRRERVPDRETGAEKRIARVCEENRLYWFRQSDPRGAALYVSREPLNDSNYNRGMAIGG